MLDADQRLGGVKVFAYCGNTNTTADISRTQPRLETRTAARSPSRRWFTLTGPISFQLRLATNGRFSAETARAKTEAVPGSSTTARRDAIAELQFHHGQRRHIANVSPLLPTATGNDTVTPTTHAWYHVALTYTGNTPTNSDTPCVLTFYWTLFDPTRTNADVLVSYTNSAWGTLGGGPIPAIGGSARRNNGVGNAGGLNGLIDEVRVSGICRSPATWLLTRIHPRRRRRLSRSRRRTPWWATARRCPWSAGLPARCR